MTTEGLHWYNNGTINVMSTTCPDGFVTGVIYHKQLSKQKRHYYNNGIINIKLLEGCEIPNGFVRGRTSMSQEQRIKISNSETGKKISQQQIDNFVGRTCYNNGVHEKYLRSEDEIPEGYIKGRLPISEELKKVRSLSAKGRICYNNGYRNIFLKPNDPIPDGFVRGGACLSEEKKQLISQIQKNPEVKQKIYNTKKDNNSFRTSKPEKILYKILCDKYGKDDVIHPYGDDPRYPFNCDFYIKSKDLFIELNLHFTHSDHPFNPSSEEDIELLNKWKSKQAFYKDKNGNNKKNQYFVAEEVWTIRDPLKLNVARENNLNYKTIYKDEWRDILCTIEQSMRA